MASKKTSSKSKSSPKKNRGIVWEDEATGTLIGLWGEEAIELSLENAKCSKETLEIYRRVKVQMDWKIFLSTGKYLNKMKKLRQKYKVEKDKSKKSGRGRRKGWTFFSKMDEILAHRPNTQPLVCLNSSLNEQITGNGDESDDKNSGDNMLFSV